MDFCVEYSQWTPKPATPPVEPTAEQVEECARWLFNSVPLGYESFPRAPLGGEREVCRKFYRDIALLVIRRYGLPPKPAPEEPHTLTPEQIAKAREIISRMPAVPSEIVPIQGDDHKPPTGARP
jgi:hypothetical protein